MSSTGTAPPALDADPAMYLAVHRALDEEVADALMSDRDREIRDRVRVVAAHEIAPGAADTDRTHDFAGPGYQALARAGLAGLLFPVRLGGSADSTVAYAAAVEEICAACPATSLIYMTQTHAAYPILLAGGPGLARRYIPGLLDGSAYGSLAITEPDAGSDVSSLATGARRNGDEYVINGAKTFITTGDRAGVIICFATTDRSARRDGVSAFVVDGDAPGLTRGAPLSKMGMHGSSTAELFLTDVRVPRANRLGEEGGAWRIVMSAVIKSRISAAGQGVGIARGAYAHVLVELRRRHGARLPSDIAARLAGMRGRILQARLLLLATAAQVDRLDDGDDERPLPTGTIGMMKQQCTDVGVDIAAEAVGLLGADGDRRDLGVERYLRDALVTQIYDGTNDIQRMLIARDTGTRLAAALDGRHTG